MAHIDLYIVAAGIGSRMKINVPKALVRIADDPCLSTTLQTIATKFRRVFVVTNSSLCEQWRTYFEGFEAACPEIARLVVNLPIRSGFGDGHATLHGLFAAEDADDSVLARDIVVVWGDVFFPHGLLIDELLSIGLNGSGLFPVVHVSRPYVSLLVNENMQCVAANFSRFGEPHSAGLHDQSVFRFDRPRLRASLLDLHNALWKNDHYISPGGELSLLYAAHHLYNTGNPAYVYETEYPTLSFNTIEEVAAIQEGLGLRCKVVTAPSAPCSTVCQ